MAAPDYENDLDAFKKNAKQILAAIKNGEPAPERLRTGSPRAIPLSCPNHRRGPGLRTGSPAGRTRCQGEFRCPDARPVEVKASCGSALLLLHKAALRCLLRAFVLEAAAKRWTARSVLLLIPLRGSRSKGPH